MEIIQEEVAPKGVKKRRFSLFRASLVCFVVFTLLCGLAYPLSVTLAAQTAFPYEANGSQIIVTMPDGAKTVYGSELIGQSYESAEYLFGRVIRARPPICRPKARNIKSSSKRGSRSAGKSLRPWAIPIGRISPPSWSLRAGAG